MPALRGALDVHSAIDAHKITVLTAQLQELANLKIIVFQQDFEVVFNPAPILR